MGKDKYPEPVGPESCLQCSGNEFGVEEARLPTKWNGGSHLVQLYICKACSAVFTYYLKKSNVSS